MEDDSLKIWRGYTPLLLVTIILLGGLTTFFAQGKLEAIDSDIKSSFSLIGGVKASLDDYKVTAETHFATLDQKIADISQRINYQNKGG